MEVVEIVLKLTGMMAYLFLVVWWFVTWVGMHNNVADGNTFKMIYPFAVFDKTLFNEKGNKWRISHLYADLSLIVFSIIYWGYQYYKNQCVS